MDEEKTLSDKLSGRLKHPEDAGGKRVYTGKILRSPVAEGSITSIELPEMPSGLVSIVSREIPGAGKIKFGGVPKGDVWMFLIEFGTSISQYI